MTLIRKALLRDIPRMVQVINDYAAKGIMLPRTEFEMAENIRDFVVVEAAGSADSTPAIVGCGALHFYTPTSAEVRSLAVDPNYKAGGLGRRIVEALEAEAIEHGLATMFAFTYVPGFFTKLGFDQVDRGELPLKAWKDCLRCPKFQACDEIAMLKRLGDEPVTSARSNITQLLPVLGVSAQFPVPAAISRHET